MLVWVAVAWPWDLMSSAGASKHVLLALHSLLYLMLVLGRWLLLLGILYATVAWKTRASSFVSNRGQFVII